MSDILKVCDEIDAAGKKATPRPWVRVDDFLDRQSGGQVARCELPIDAKFIALAANHAQDLTAVVRRLVELRLIVDVRCQGPAFPDSISEETLGRYSKIGAYYVGRLAAWQEMRGLLASPPEREDTR